MTEAKITYIGGSHRCKPGVKQPVKNGPTVKVWNDPITRVSYPL